jgi:phosphatidylserine decarboxylase
MGRPIGYHLIRALPRRALTQAAGAAASLPLPRILRSPIYRAYATAVGADLSECGEAIDSFVTFNRFFARPLTEGAREVKPELGFVSPADGRIDASGLATKGRLIQAKGIDYALADLLADDGLADALSDAVYTTVYLSPADYHRVHAPCDAIVRRVRYCPGDLWPVNGLSVPYVDGLFRRNERVVFEFESAWGRAALVMIGATIVGGIEVAHSEIGRVPRSGDSFEWTPEWEVRAGEEVGTFLLGSTVVLIAQGVRPPPEERIGTAVRMGETLLDVSTES